MNDLSDCNFRRKERLGIYGCVLRGMLGYGCTSWEHGVGLDWKEIYSWRSRIPRFFNFILLRSLRK
jgi:hypothetical protein